MSNYSISTNALYNSTEVLFESKPCETIRDILKSLKFRWNPKKSVWYGFTPAADLEKILLSGKVEKTTTKKETKSDYNVKVGDLFYCSWGYEQTNVDFFQVVAVVGKKSVRVREVHPQMIEEKATCGMAADRTYKATSELLPPVNSIFINDDEKGDLKRLKSYDKDSYNNPIFEIGNGGYICRKYNGQALYESWYY